MAYQCVWQPPMRINTSKDQGILLSIEGNRYITAAIHSSVLFPEVFGGLSCEDRDHHFGGKRFRKYASSRRVLTL